MDTKENLGIRLKASRKFTGYASTFERFAFHEAMHAGQLTGVRQSLKHPRLVNFHRA